MVEVPDSLRRHPHVDPNLLERAIATVEELDQSIVAGDFASFEERARAVVPYVKLKIWNEGKVELTTLAWSPDIVLGIFPAGNPPRALLRGVVALRRVRRLGRS